MTPGSSPLCSVRVVPAEAARVHRGPGSATSPSQWAAAPSDSSPQRTGGTQRRICRSGGRRPCVARRGRRLGSSGRSSVYLRVLRGRMSGSGRAGTRCRPWTGRANAAFQPVRRERGPFRRRSGRFDGGWFGTWSVRRGMLPIRPRVRLGAILLGRCRGGGSACPLRPEPEIRPRRTRRYTEGSAGRPGHAQCPCKAWPPTTRSTGAPLWTSRPRW